MNKYHLALLSGIFLHLLGQTKHINKFKRRLRSKWRFYCVWMNLFIPICFTHYHLIVIAN